MAIWVRKTSPARTRARTEYLESRNDSSARKFVTPDAVRNNSPSESTSNAEFLVNVTTGLRSLPVAAGAVAAQARDDISLSRDAQQNMDGVIDPERSALIGFSEEDVNLDQDALAVRAADEFEPIADSDVRGAVGRRTRSYIRNSRHAVAPITVRNALTLDTNPHTPDIEEASVDVGLGKGAIDNFHVTLLLNLHKDALSEVRALRIFRAQDPNPSFTRPLATLSSDGIQRLSSLRSRKNEDPSQNQMRLEQHGVPNATTLLNSFDPFLGARRSVSDQHPPFVVPQTSGQHSLFSPAPIDVPPALAHLDRSVLENVNVLSNIQRDPIYGYSVSPNPNNLWAGSNINSELRLGDRQQANVQEAMAQSQFVVQQNNQLNFQQIVIISMDKLKYRRIGDLLEIQFDDDTVSYGQAYKYFAVTVDKSMRQSSRSQIVTAIIEGLRIPERPSFVAVSSDQTKVGLSMTVSDQLVEKFEIHRLEYTPDRKQKIQAVTIADSQGFNISIQDREIASNNYILIGECVNGMQTGGQFTDKQVVPGRLYTYRVYSVDIFGNKSESPFQVDAFIPDLEQQFVNIQAPSILAEVHAQTRKIKLSFQCDAPTAARLRIERRDLTIGQESFGVPASPGRNIIGMGSLSHRRGLEGERLYNPEADISWNGHLAPLQGQSQEKIDYTVSSDHIYQYRIWAEDSYGNRSSYSFTSPLMVVRRALINEPVGVRVSVTSSTAGLHGVYLTWVDGNVDKPAEDLLGNQTTLAETAVRTLYQVQRLKNGESVWSSFPLMSGTSLFDPFVGEEADVAPKYRPAYPEYNQNYLYRVQAVQTGSFVSNFCSPVSISTGKQVFQPLNFKILTPNVQRRPFFGMLNWDTHPDSGVIDYWEIERAAINNFAASRLNTNNPADFDKVQYTPFKKVFRESSRFASRVIDSTDIKSQVISGQHWFMDTQIDFGNTYFYRIRAVSVDQSVSRWSYKGLKLTSTTYERKWVPTLTSPEKERLSTHFQPLAYNTRTRAKPRSTVSLLPQYATPDSARASPRLEIDFERGNR